MTVDLRLGDCLEVLPTLAGYDAVVTDPPYGLGNKWQGGKSWVSTKGKAPVWDLDTVDQAFMQSLPQLGPCIIWGGNYYALPPARGWLIWDKKQEHSSGHAELAWTNLDQPIRTFRLSRVEAYSRMDKQHPTQKPLTLMEWCISFLPEGCTVLDPFMGSGTTGVACVKLGRNFIGIEKDPTYYATATHRIAEAQAQLPLPVTP